MEKISLDYSNTLNFINKQGIIDLQKNINLIHDILHKKNEKDKDWIGWVDYPNTIDLNEIKKIERISRKIKDQSDVFIVIGVGGSYLGARAAIEVLTHSFYNELSKDNRKNPKIYFAGHNMSSTYLKDIFDIIDGHNVSINVISKSGTTIEPMITFRLLMEYMEKKYNKTEIKNRIYITTDKNKGTLKELADKEGYQTLIIPDNIGGRYSVLTSVGLLPMAVAGIDINEVMQGARIACRQLISNNLEGNPCYEYAAIRNLLYSIGKTVEIIVSYEPSLFYFGEWFTQLFGESEGKAGKGIFPTSMSFVTDLHSMGQYVQEGRRNIFETVLNVKKSKDEIIINENNSDIDRLNYLKGKTLDFINKKAMEGALSAHVTGGVPNLIINIPELSPYYFGYLVYFFKKACAMSSYLLGVYPFDQPGVEEYKRNMFKLLGKPGY